MWSVVALMWTVALQNTGVHRNTLTSFKLTGKTSDKTAAVSLKYSRLSQIRDMRTTVGQHIGFMFMLPVSLACRSQLLNMTFSHVSSLRDTLKKMRAKSLFIQTKTELLQKLTASILKPLVQYACVHLGYLISQVGGKNIQTNIVQIVLQSKNQSFAFLTQDPNVRLEVSAITHKHTHKVTHT